MQLKLPDISGRVIVIKNEQQEAKKCYENSLKTETGVFMVMEHPPSVDTPMEVDPLEEAVPTGVTPVEAVPAEGTPREAASMEEASREASPMEEASGEASPAEEALAEAAPKREGHGSESRGKGA